MVIIRMDSSPPAATLKVDVSRRHRRSRRPRRCRCRRAFPVALPSVGDSLPRELCDWRCGANTPFVFGIGGGWCPVPPMYAMYVRIGGVTVCWCE